MRKKFVVSVEKEMAGRCYFPDFPMFIFTPDRLPNCAAPILARITFRLVQTDLLLNHLVRTGLMNIPIYNYNV